MRHLIFVTGFFFITSSLLTGCGPFAALEVIGSTITNASYNSANRDLNSSAYSSDQKALEIAEANYNLGVEYLRQGDNENTLIRLKRSIDAKKDFAPAYNMLGVLYQRLGDNKAAETYFKQAIKIDKTDSSTLNNYGLFLCAQDRRDEAENIFLQGVNNPLYEKPELALTNLGICFIPVDENKSQDYFVLALNKNNNFSPALLEMAELSFGKGDYEKANYYFQRYRLLSRQTPKSIWLGIRVSEKMGDEDNLASYKLLLRNQYSDSDEARLLQESKL